MTPVCGNHFCNFVTSLPKMQFQRPKQRLKRRSGRSASKAPGTGMKPSASLKVTFHFQMCTITTIVQSISHVSIMIDER